MSTSASIERAIDSAANAAVLGHRIPHGRATGGGVMNTFDISGRADLIFAGSCAGVLDAMCEARPQTRGEAIQFVNRGWTLERMLRAIRANQAHCIALSTGYRWKK